MLFLLSVTVIPVNTLQFYQLFYQAIGKFKDYSRNIFVSFLVLSHFTGWFVGGVSYLIIALIINVIFNRKEIMEIINVAFKR